MRISLSAKNYYKSKIITDRTFFDLTGLIEREVKEMDIFVFDSTSHCCEKGLALPDDPFDIQSLK
jgi:hypothetical protein